MEKSSRNTLLEICLFLSCVALVYFFNAQKMLLTVILAASSALSYVLWHRKGDAYFFAAGAVTGSIGEIAAAQYGAWQYPSPDFLGIPLWLPLLWGMGAMLVKRLAEAGNEYG